MSKIQAPGKGKSGRGHHTWNKAEDKALVEFLLTLKQDTHWKGDNGTFRSGYLTQLEKMFESRFPEAELKANPHIESRVKTMKKQYNAIAEMLSIGSGFGWSDDEKCLTVSKDVFDDWVRTHPQARGLRNKCFPHFDDFTIIFGKDRANGTGAEHATDLLDAVGLEKESKNELNDEAHVDDEFVDAQAIELDGTDEVAEFVDAQASTGATSKKQKSSKKAKSADGTSELIHFVSNFHANYEVGLNDFKAYLKKESTTNDQIMALPAALRELEGFSREQLVKVGAHIAKEPWKVKYFFALPVEDDSRKDFVQLQLDECCPAPYRPAFDDY